MTQAETPMTADPRGPMRKVTGIFERTDGTLLATDCGHVYDRNQTFTYKVGQEIRCFECGKTDRLERDRAALIAALEAIKEKSLQDDLHPATRCQSIGKLCDATLAQVRG